MLDIKFIRENKDLVADAARKKHVDFAVDTLITLDDKRLEALQAFEALRAEQNAMSDKIASEKDANVRNDMIANMKILKESLNAREEEMRAVIKEWQMLMLQVPNIPDMSVPEGNSEEDNKEILTWGEKPTFDFEPKDHIELMTEARMVDFERGVKVHGFRGYFLIGDGAELSWALWNYAREFFGKKNFVPFIAPAIVRKENLYGTGHLPGGAEDIYKTQDEDYLSGTAEIPMMGYHSDEVLSTDELPKRYLAYSPCYRREAGSHGKDTKGLIRVHEFFKLEQLILCEASHAESVKIHEEINRNFEEFMESLEIPYRRLEICTGDMKLAYVKSYDTEGWMPSQNAYRELSSTSYYHDFQARRFNIKYKDRDGKSHFVHSLNSTAVATPRILACIVENYQTADGKIRVPEVLKKYLNKDYLGN